ncbi:hypothetical protein B0J14DRAFT_664041 [Halenospora varia]|nr:hypothetical protein B0J14DRAFT_664041 [Halenospora varia]
MQSNYAFPDTPSCYPSFIGNAVCGMGGEVPRWFMVTKSSVGLFSSSGYYGLRLANVRRQFLRISPKAKVFRTQELRDSWLFRQSNFQAKLNLQGRKHMDKHERPYKCPENNCKTPDFASAGDLKRHQHSIHGKHTFTCSVLTYNLAEHMKRVHKADQTSLIQRFGEMSSPFGSMDGNILDKHSPYSQSQLDDTPIQIIMDKVSLVAKLEELHARRALLEKRKKECDEQIAAMEKVLTIN